MKIKIDASNLTVTLENPSVLAAASEIAFEIEGAEGLDAPSAKVWVFSINGGILAVCEEITESEGIVSGTLSTKFDPVKNLFIGRRPDQRLPVVLAVEDDNRSWASSCVEMANKPSMSTLPISTPDYVTREELAALGQLDPEAPADQIIEKVNEIIAG